MLLVIYGAEILRAGYRIVSLLWQCIKFPLFFKLPLPVRYHEFNFETRDGSWLCLGASFT